MSENAVTGIFVAVLIVVSLGLWILAKKSPEVNTTNGSNSLNKQPVTQTRVKKMAALGTFYPAAGKDLDNKLSTLLNEVQPVNNAKPVRILIIPHAGLEYSGSVAAAAYKQVTNQPIEKVILLGASHTKSFENAAVFTAGEWETPLGNVTVDANLGDKISSRSQNITPDFEVHEKDHNLEMQVVWIKKLWPAAKILPIMISNPNSELEAALAFRIAQNFDDKTLLIISSDLSHYPDNETAKTADAETLRAIIGGMEEWNNYLTTTKNTGLPGIETLACGQEAIKIGLKVARLLNLDKPEVITYANSADASENKSRVVGYGAVKIAGAEVKLIVPRLDAEAKTEAVEIAKTTLNDFVAGKIISSPGEIKNPGLLEPLGAFVTLRKNGQLRGCIGGFEPNQPLYQVIRQKTIEAASKDPRFNPVTAEELPEISLEISVMTPKRPVDRWEEIDTKNDGVVIELNDRTGTFLPQVAAETGWNKEQLLEELCSQKMGLDKSCYKNPAARFWVYQAQVFE